VNGKEKRNELPAGRNRDAGVHLPTTTAVRGITSGRTVCQNNANVLMIDAETS